VRKVQEALYLAGFGLEFQDGIGESGKEGDQALAQGQKRLQSQTVSQLPCTHSEDSRPTAQEILDLLEAVFQVNQNLYFGSTEIVLENTVLARIGAAQNQIENPISATKVISGARTGLKEPAQVVPEFHLLLNPRA